MQSREKNAKRRKKGSHRRGDKRNEGGARDLDKIERYLG